MHWCLAGARAVLILCAAALFPLQHWPAIWTGCPWMDIPRTRDLAPFRKMGMDKAESATASCDNSGAQAFYLGVGLRVVDQRLGIETPAGAWRPRARVLAVTLAARGMCCGDVGGSRRCGVRGWLPPRSCVWANRRVFAHLKTLPAGVAEQKVTSAFPSVIAVLRHTCRADELWLEFMRGLSRVEAMERARRVRDLVESADLAQLEARFEGGAGRYRALLTGERAPHRPIVWAHPTAGRLDASPAELLRHVCNHETYHRGNIMAMLRQMGHRGAPTGYVLFLMETWAGSAHRKEPGGEAPGSRWITAVNSARRGPRVGPVRRQGPRPHRPRGRWRPPRTCRRAASGLAFRQRRARRSAPATGASCRRSRGS